MADDVLILIPARMASTRLPGKPLADIAGQPMIVHVLHRAVEAKARRGRGGNRQRGGVRGCGKGRRPRGDDARRPRFGVRPHLRGARADRPGRPRAASWSTCRATCRRWRRATSRRRSSRSPTPRSTSRRSRRKSPRPQERDNPNVVKLVGSPVAPSRLRALYFTRATAPSGEGPLYHHIGLYAYRREALARFVDAPAVAARAARTARAAARAGRRHADRRHDRRQRAARRRYAGGPGNARARVLGGR